MKNSIFYIGIILLLYINISCSSNKNNLQKIITKEWIIDSLGCNGLRKPIAYKLSDNEKLLINKKYASIITLIGRANKKYIKNKNTYYYYFISCAYAPLVIGGNNNIRKYSKEVESFIIITNDSGNIIDCKFSIP